MNSGRGKKRRWPGIAEQPSLALGCKNPTLKKVYLHHAGEKVGHVALVLWEVLDEESSGVIALTPSHTLRSSTPRPALSNLRLFLTFHSPQELQPGSPGL